uniref:hypothetical protein n=1 Tax=Clostridium sp. NkU-1 TaxID=1095009 RepID=UPI000B142628
MFLSTMFLAPHPPLDIPMPWHGKYNREEVVLPDNVGVWYLEWFHCCIPAIWHSK